MPDNIVKLSNTILNSPQKIEVSPVSSTAETIKQYVYYTNRTLKSDLLKHIIDSKNIDQVLIFTRTKHGADRVAKKLIKQDIKASSIHGDKAQNQRQNALTAFKEGKLKALVATDIAARGIDIDRLSYVINYEVPNLPETYVHRIGRSGRAGESGIAISLCEPEENDYLKDIQKLIGNKIEKVENNPFPQTEKPMTAEEKKEWEKEKQQRKQEFFANRKKNNPRNKQQNNNRKKENKPDSTKAKPNNGDAKPKPKSKPNHKKKKDNKLDNKMQGSRYKGMSDNLKSKFMWPLE
jgi:ATP-dependent RNA helicase RhlE